MFHHWVRICSLVLPGCLFFVCVVSFLFVSYFLCQAAEANCWACLFLLCYGCFLVLAVAVATSSLTRYFVDDKDKKAPHIQNHSHDLDSSAFWDYWNTQTSVKVAPKNWPAVSISYFIWFPILQLKLKLLQAPWTARIRRLPTLMPLTSKRSARNAKHMAMTVVWVPFFRRRGKITSNNDEVWQKMNHSWHCWQVRGVLLNAKNWLNLILEEGKELCYQYVVLSVIDSSCTLDTKYSVKLLRSWPWKQRQVTDICSCRFYVFFGNVSCPCSENMWNHICYTIG